MLRCPRPSIACFSIAVALALAAPAAASAQLTATFNGAGGYSADALGQEDGGGTLQAQVPAGSTLVQAYLYGTYHDGSNPDLSQRTIDFDGTNVELTRIAEFASFFATARANVTSQVAAKVGSGGGITNFAVNNDPGQLDGVTLLVVYSNPSLPSRRIAVFDGIADPRGDGVTFQLGAPIDKTAAGFSAVMSVGVGYSFQGPQAAGPHDCDLFHQQATSLTVNGGLLSACAGHWDDGIPSSSGLITVGGVGDSTDNPTPPESPATDDELYDLAPFVKQGDTAIRLETENGSLDDNLFLVVMDVTLPARPTSKEQCKNGGWRNFPGFKNQGDCVSYVATHGRNGPG
jgi:hypothetical protein